MALAVVNYVGFDGLNTETVRRLVWPLPEYVIFCSLIPEELHVSRKFDAQCLYDSGRIKKRGKKPGNCKIPGSFPWTIYRLKSLHYNIPPAFNFIYFTARLEFS